MPDSTENNKEATAQVVPPTTTTETIDIKTLNEEIQRESSFVDLINIEMNKVIVGQNT